MCLVDFPKCHVNRYVNRMTAVEIRKRNCGSKAAVAPEKTFGEGAAPGELVGEFDVPLVITVLHEKKDLTLSVPS